MKSIFAHIKEFFEKVFGSTNWERIAINTLAVVGPLLETLVALTAGEPAAALVTKIVSTIQADLQTAASLITAVHSGQGTGTAGQLQNLLNGIQSNLSQLLTAAEIKNPDTQAKVTAVVNTISQEVAAVLSTIPASPVAPVPPAAPTIT